MSQKDKQHKEELYLPMDAAIIEEQTACLEKLYDFNQTRPCEVSKRQALLKEMFAEIGEHCYIEPPLFILLGLGTMSILVMGSMPTLI